MKFKKNVIFLTISFMIGFSIFCHSILNVKAEEETDVIINRYYTSIQISKGDTLWSIANNYIEGGNLTIDEYIKELKSMNSLNDDTIHAGEHLTILYFSSMEQ